MRRSGREFSEGVVAGFRKGFQAGAGSFDGAFVSRRDRPSSSMGFAQVCKHTRAGPGRDIELGRSLELSVQGEQVQGPQHAMAAAHDSLLQRLSSSGSGGILKKGLTSRPQTASTRHSTRTSRPVSPNTANNPFFLTSVDTEVTEQCDYLESLARQVSRPPSPTDGRPERGIEKYVEGVQELIDKQDESRRRLREQRISQAIQTAQLGPSLGRLGSAGSNPSVPKKGIRKGSALWIAESEPWEPQHAESHGQGGYVNNQADGERWGGKWEPLPEDTMPLDQKQFLSMNPSKTGNSSRMISNEVLQRRLQFPPESEGRAAPQEKPMLPLARTTSTPLEDIEAIATRQDAYESMAFAEDSQAADVSMEFLSITRSESPTSPTKRGRAPKSTDARGLEATMSDKLTKVMEQEYHEKRSQLLRNRMPEFYAEKEFKENMLRQCKYTTMLSDEHLKFLASECQVSKFRTSDIIVRERDRQLCMYILSVGEVGEYKGIPDVSKLQSIDPSLMSSKRVRTFSSPNDTLCVLSLFLGSPAGSTFAAMKSTVLLRVPASCIQPILSNHLQLVQHMSAILLSSGIIPIDHNEAGGKMQIMRLANQISGFHSDFARTHPGGSWDLSPRSRARQPRTKDKVGDVPVAESREAEETQPCVGRKDGVLKPSRPQLTTAHTPINLPKNGHLSPRYLERDRFSGACATRLSTRSMAEVMKSTKSRPVIPCLPEEHENWGLQSSVVEKPVVKAPNSALAPVHSVLSSHGTTQEALIEWDKARDLHANAPLQTKMGRDMRKHVEMAAAIKNINTPFQCKISHDPNEAHMLRQLQYEPSLAEQPSAYLCGRESMRRMEQKEQVDKQRLMDMKRQMVSFECETRLKFENADMKGMIQHPHYHSRRDEKAKAKNAATRDALPLRYRFFAFRNFLSHSTF